MADLPEFHLPLENDTYIPLTDVLFDGAPSTTYEVGYAELGVRPVTNFAAAPGPKAPKAKGRYLVMVRQSGVPAKIGILVVD